MKTQTVVFTPGTEMTSAGAVAHISTLLPYDVISHLTECTTDGTRITSVVSDGNTHTVTTQWDDAQAEQYKTLMDGISAGVKSQLIADGWSITFTPETVDL